MSIFRSALERAIERVRARRNAVLPNPTPVPVTPAPVVPTPAPVVVAPPTPTPTSSPIPTTSPAENAWLKQVSEKFRPGHEIGAVPSSLLDDAISSILGEQQGGAQQFLNRGKARGIFNDVGYNAGLQTLNNQAQIGRSELSNMGTSVIDKYRTNLDKIGDDAYTAATGYKEGNPFSLDPYMTQYNDVLGRANTNAAGELRGMLGGRNFFDFANLSNRAGQAQGAINLRDADVATALAERKRRNSMSRGLGSQGAF